MDGGSNMRQVIVYPGEDGYYVVECPSLPGCISQGSTKEEAITNIKEAIQLYTEALLDQGMKIPAEKFDSMLVAV
jgi:predicted RNase H-like HicB family nuclease